MVLHNRLQGDWGNEGVVDVDPRVEARVEGVGGIVTAGYAGAVMVDHCTQLVPAAGGVRVFLASRWGEQIYIREEEDWLNK